MNIVDAALGWCVGERTAQLFSTFTSMMNWAGSGAVVVARAFTVDGTLEQSFTKCPVFPQKRQRLLSMWCCRLRNSTSGGSHGFDLWVPSAYFHGRYGSDFGDDRYP